MSNAKRAGQNRDPAHPRAGGRADGNPKAAVIAMMQTADELTDRIAAAARLPGCGSCAIQLYRIDFAARRVFALACGAGG